MPRVKQKPLSPYLRRLKQRGVIRVEVHVRKDDAALVRGVARALADPQRADEARALLRARFAAEGAEGLKALLASAPLERIDLTRDRDTGRPVKNPASLLRTVRKTAGPKGRPNSSSNVSARFKAKLRARVPD